MIALNNYPRTLYTQEIQTLRDASKQVCVSKGFAGMLEVSQRVEVFNEIDHSQFSIAAHSRTWQLYQRINIPWKCGWLQTRHPDEGSIGEQC